MDDLKKQLVDACERELDYYDIVNETSEQVEFGLIIDFLFDRLSADGLASDDLISRDYVMNEVLSLHGVGGMYLYDPTEVHAIIDNAPSVFEDGRIEDGK